MSDYDRRCDAHHREYKSAYADWLASLSPAERAQIADLDLDEPLADHSQVSGTTREDKRPSHGPRPAAVTGPCFAIDTDAEDLAQRFHLPLASAAALSSYIEQRIQSAAAIRQSASLHSIIGFILQAENVKTSAAGLAYASGLAEVNQFGSIRDYAKRQGLSPAAISKQAIKWREILGLPPSVHAKPEASRKAYSDAQRAKHWRKQKLARP